MASSPGVRVHPLMTARMKAMPAFYERPGGPKPLAMARGLGLHVPRSRWFWLPIPAFLLEHPEAGPVLVDTGLHEQVATDKSAALGRLGGLAFTIDMKPEWAVPHQLRARGVDPADVETIVMTHLHYDHASGLSHFPRATVHVDAREHADASAGRLMDGYMPRLLRTPGQRWETFSHDEEVVDLLGDGTIRLLRTPGHTSGHRSVALRLASGGDLLLTGDAAYNLPTIERSLTPLMTWKDDAFRASLARVQAWTAEHPGAPVIPGHDPETWATLAEVYA
ncbi:MAG TPA: N-acyl homoserine lactonase family protein [Baekduia sp.]|uniref:N-acyl homoserine lactonase family protein n=1 Tax=Baekduia sp. TaxID=2600305 RepID=UPI002D78749E|nr:N-acyl homoserine lactonase family protein [Baekduia sp.]HET6508431.1 N-acyl homoserine lactonase family protein [Baekduia sp.]